MDFAEEIRREFQYHGELAEQYGDFARFVGRESDLEAINRYIESSNPSPLIIYGAAGVGKTALIARAVLQAEDRGERLVFRFIGATPESTGIQYLLNSLSQHAVVNYFTGVQTSSDYRKMLDKFYWWFAAIAKKKRIVIFIDGLDLLSNENGAHSFDWLVAQLPPQVRFILTIQEESPLLHTLLKKVSIQNGIQLSPLLIDERELLLDKWLQDSKKTLSPSQHATARLYFKQNGLPLHLALAYKTIEKWLQPQDKVSISSDIYELFEIVVTSLFEEKQHNPLLVTKVLGYLSASKKGMALDELWELLTNELIVIEEIERFEAKLPVKTLTLEKSLKQLISDLESNVLLTDHDGKILITPRYRPLMKRVSVNLSKDTQLLKFHRELAEYFCRQPYIIETTEGKEFNLRKLSELAFQQCHGHQWDNLAETLGGFDFIEAKCNAGMTDELIDDYSKVCNYLKNETTNVKPEIKNLLVKFASFVNDQAPFFHQYGNRAGFCAQQAFNQNRNNEVAKAASSYLKKLSPELCMIIHYEDDRKSITSNREIKQIIKGHTSYVYCTAVSADGNLAVSGSQDEPIMVWDVSTGRCRQMLEGHIGRVTAAMLTGDGKKAITTGWDKTLRVWNIEIGEEIKMIAAAEGYIDTAAISDNGNIAVVGSRDGRVIAWDIENEELILSKEAHREAVNAISLSADGKIAVSAGCERNIKVWEIGSGSLINSFDCRSSKFIRSLSLSPDGSLLVSGGDDYTVRIWDVNTGNCLKEMEGHTGGVLSTALSYDDDIAISAAKDCTIRVWNIKEGTCLRILERKAHIPSAVAIAANGTIAVSGGDDQTIIAWNIFARVSRNRDNEKRYRLNDSCYSLNGDVKVSGKFSTVLTMAFTKGSENCRTIERDEEINVLNVSPDGSTAITAPLGKNLNLWDIKTGENLGILQGHSGNITAATFSLDAGKALSADRHGVVRYWDVKSKTCLNVFPCRAQSIALSSDGSFAVAAGDDRVIRVWDTKTGACIRKLMGHIGDIHAIALCLYGRLLFSAATDKSLRVWDIEKGCCIAIKGHHSEIIHLAIIDGALVLEDSQEQVTVVTLSNHELPVTGPVGIREILGKHSDRMLRLTVPTIGALSKAQNDDIKWRCSVCGKRINLIMAPARGVTDKGLKDCPMHDYCYFFAKPVLPQERLKAKCPHWISYEVMNFEIELERK